MTTLRNIKKSCIVQGIVEHSRTANPITEADGKSVVCILSSSVSEEDGIAIKNKADKMIADEIERLRKKFPGKRYEKSLFGAINPHTDGNLWSLKVKRRCSCGTNGMMPKVPIFDCHSGKDTRADRGGREITEGSTINIVFYPTVYTYNDWGGVITVGVTFKLDAVQIVKEESATASSGNTRALTAADFGLEVGSEEDEFEIFPGLKL